MDSLLVNEQAVQGKQRVLQSSWNLHADDLRLTRLSQSKERQRYYFPLVLIENECKRKFCPFSRNGILLKSFGRPWQDLNLQSPVSETDALSIRPQGRSYQLTNLGFCQLPRFQHSSFTWFPPLLGNWVVSSISKSVSRRSLVAKVRRKQSQQNYMGYYVVTKNVIQSQENEVHTSTCFT